MHKGHSNENCEAVHADKYLSSATKEEHDIVIRNCHTALDALHSSDYVHGDFRPCNM